MGKLCVKKLLSKNEPLCLKRKTKCTFRRSVNLRSWEGEQLPPLSRSALSVLLLLAQQSFHTHICEGETPSANRQDWLTVLF